MRHRQREARRYKSVGTHRAKREKNTVCITFERPKQVTLPPRASGDSLTFTSSVKTYVIWSILRSILGVGIPELHSEGLGRMAIGFRAPEKPHPVMPHGIWEQLYNAAIAALRGCGNQQHLYVTIALHPCRAGCNARGCKRRWRPAYENDGS